MLLLSEYSYSFPLSTPETNHIVISLDRLNYACVYVCPPLAIRYENFKADVM